MVHIATVYLELCMCLLSSLPACNLRLWLDHTKHSAAVLLHCSSDCHPSSEPVLHSSTDKCSSFLKGWFSTGTGSGEGKTQRKQYCHKTHPIVKSWYGGNRRQGNLELKTVRKKRSCWTRSTGEELTWWSAWRIQLQSQTQHFLVHDTRLFYSIFVL